MELFHYTSLLHIRGIAKYGLTVGDVPTDLVKNQGRVGVWLTDLGNPSDLGLDGSRVDKKRLRLSVQVSEASAVLHRWTDWADKNVTPFTRVRLSEIAPTSKNWWIYLGVIPRKDIVACIDMSNGEALDIELVPPNRSEVAGVPTWRREAWHRKLLKQVAQARKAKANR